MSEKVDYATALLAYLVEQPREARKPAPLPTGPGRRKVLDKIRNKGQFLKAIAEISSANKTLWSNDAIANRLRARPEYTHLSQRQLRRDVAEALHWRADPHGKWPSAGPLDKKLREVVLEMLRCQLEITQYQLMARNP
jgi:hypothetical protein